MLAGEAVFADMTHLEPLLGIYGVGKILLTPCSA